VYYVGTYEKEITTHLIHTIKVNRNYLHYIYLLA